MKGSKHTEWLLVARKVKVSAHDKGTIRHNVQRTLDRGAVAVQNDGVAQLKDGPVVVGLRLGHGTQDRHLLSPLDGVVIDGIDARGGRATSAPSHDAGGDGGMGQD